MLLFLVSPQFTPSCDMTGQNRQLWPKGPGLRISVLKRHGDGNKKFNAFVLKTFRLSERLCCEQMQKHSYIIFNMKWEKKSFYRECKHFAREPKSIEISHFPLITFFFFIIRPPHRTPWVLTIGSQLQSFKDTQNIISLSTAYHLSFLTLWE